MSLRQLLVGTAFIACACAIASPATSVPAELKALSEGEAAYACSAVLFDYSKMAQTAEGMAEMGRQASRMGTGWAVKASSTGLDAAGAKRIRLFVNGLSPRSTDAVLFHCMAQGSTPQHGR